MLYYIIPPFIIIIGLAILASFLFRKVSRTPQSELKFLEEGTGSERKSFWQGLGKNISQITLKMLEKLMQRFKLYSLKIHNHSQNWFQSIKNKREKQISHQAETILEKPAETKVDLPLEQKIINSRTKIIQTEDIKTSPMVSRVVVLPEQEKAVKDRLEEALIERIASNPSDIEAYERLGDYYIEQDNQEESLECFRHVLKLSPVHRKAKLRVRRLERMLGK